MRGLMLFLISGICQLPAFVVGQSSTRFVSTTGTNSNPASATSWASCTTDLQGAINSLSATGGEVWVAVGIYKPGGNANQDRVLATSHNTSSIVVCSRSDMAKKIGCLPKRNDKNEIR